MEKFTLFKRMNGRYKSKFSNRGNSVYRFMNMLTYLDLTSYKLVILCTPEIMKNISVWFYISIHTSAPSSYRLIISFLGYRLRFLLSVIVQIKMQIPAYIRS